MVDIYRRLLALLDAQEKRRFVLLLFMILVMGLLDVVGVAAVLPFLSVIADPGHITENRLLAWLYRSSGVADERSFLYLLGLAVFLLVVISLIFKALTQFMMIRFSTMRNFSISNRLFRGFLGKQYVWFLNRHSAELAKSMLSEVDHVVHTCLIPALELLAHSTVAIALSVLLFALEPVVMLMAVGLLVGTYVGIYAAVRSPLARIGAKRVDANSLRYKYASEALTGIKEMKLLGLEHRYAERYRAPAETFARAQAIAFSVGQIPRYVLEAIAFGGMLGFVLFKLGRTSDSLDDVIPMLGLFAFAGIRLFPALQQVYRDFTQLQFGSAALDALYALADEAREDLKQTADVVPVPLEKSMVLEDVTFAFPQSGRPAMDGVSLEVMANSTVGIVGGSGAGKTTTVDVILGLLVPSSGQMKIDGVAIGDANRAGWQKSVGYVPQQIFLIDDTVAANIALGDDPGEIDMARVERAARAAELHAFVTTEMVSGYGTLVGDRGIRLSGGQRQRIGIARALYRDPDVLVFDEATSALDNVTERAVMDAVRNISGKKTIIIIAHRLTTVMDCSTIFFMQRGRVLAQGRYAELLETCPEFRELAVTDEARHDAAAPASQ